MLSTRIAATLALCAMATSMSAQTTITNALPAVIGFVDLTTNGGIPVTPAPFDDSEHNFVSTIGNPLFPVGNVRVGNNGVAISGILIGEIGFVNTLINPTGVPANLPAGNGIICAYWDDLIPVAAGSPSVGPAIQILYPDTTFGGTATVFNNGLSATVGYAKGTNMTGTNAQWSFNAAAVPDGAVLSIFDPSASMTIAASSPLGPGSLQLHLVSGPLGGTYFFAVTLAPGTFPFGWLFGLDIAYADLGAQLAAGPPFSGPLDAIGNFSLGPIPGLPPLTMYAVGFGFPPGSSVPTEHTPPFSYTIP